MMKTQKPLFKRSGQAFNPIFQRVFWLFLVVVLIACTGDGKAEPTRLAVATASPTSEPSATPIPPTPTLEPSSTPSPTKTAIPPSPTPAPTLDAEKVCADIVKTAYDVTYDACSGTGRDQACYGNSSIAIEPQTLSFDKTGDIVNVANIESLRLSSLNTLSQEWGVSLMRLRASLSEDTASNVELILFGNVEIEPAESQASSYGAMQAFYFKSGVNDSPCEAAPDSGMMIQTPKGEGEITFLINEVSINLGSTAYFQAQPGADFVLNTVEGQATITANGVTVVSSGGTRVKVPLDSSGRADGVPSEPEPYDVGDFDFLPLTLLNEPISIAPALSQPTNASSLGLITDNLLVEDEIESNTTDTFTFTAEAGQIAYFKILGATPNCCNIFWELRDPQDKQIFSGYFNADQEYLLPESGTYTLTLRGQNDFVGPYHFQIFNVPLANEQALDLSSQTAADFATPIVGEIEAIGAQDLYHFTAEANQHLYFEILQSSTSCCDFLWTLRDEAEQVVFSSYLSGDQETILEKSGTYTLTVDGQKDALGVYSFMVHPVPPAEHFEIGIGDIIIPNPALGGIGVLEAIGAQDIYHFEATAGQTIILKVLQGTKNCCEFLWMLYDDADQELFNSYFNGEQRHTLEKGGRYTLIIDGQKDETGVYSFEIRDADANSGLTAEIDALYTEEGTIETAGAQHEYPLSFEAGQTLYFQSLVDGGTCCDLKWNLLSASGTPIFDAWFGNDQEYTLEEGGEYLLTISGYQNFTGDYSFRVVNIPPPQYFEIAIDTLLSSQDFENGAGRIEAIGAKDIYTFTLTAPQTVYFDVLSAADECCYFMWRLADESGTVLFDTWLHGDQEYTLQNGGIYTLSIDGQDATTGSYDFRLLTVPAPEYFEIELGDSIPIDSAATGIANIEAIGAKDIYTFSIDADQMIYLGISSQPSCCVLNWKLVDENDNILFDEVFNQTIETTLSGGRYTLIIDGNESFTGPYGFDILPVPPAKTFPLAIDEIVRRDDPTEGAGNIEVIGSQDRYTFTLESEQAIYFDILLKPTDCCQMRWHLLHQAADGLENIIFDTWFSIDEEYTLAPGIYNLTLDGADAFTGAYSFRMVEVPAPQVFALQLENGASVEPNGTGQAHLEAIGSQDLYTFEISQDITLSFELLENFNECCVVTWALADADGLILFDEWMLNTKAIALPKGNYTLTIDGVEAFTGEYRFQVLPVQ